MKISRSLRALLTVLLCAGLATPLALAIYVRIATGPYRHSAAAAVPAERVAVVFGAGVRGDRPSRFLAERIDAAVGLYRAGRVEKILMSGDNSRADYDEVSVMRRYAEGLGVRPEDIALDYAGFSTYESCFRARAIFGVERAVLVTQAYHLPRAIYTCRALGVEASGLAAPDWGRFPAPVLVRYSFREALATVKALVDVHLTRPQPTFLGPFEGIGEG